MFYACSSGSFCDVDFSQRGSETKSALVLRPRPSLQPMTDTAARFIDDVYYIEAPLLVILRLWWSAVS